MNQSQIYVLCSHCYEDGQINIEGAYRTKCKAINAFKNDINKYLSHLDCFLDENFTVVKHNNTTQFSIKLETDKETYAVLIINNEADCYWFIEETKLDNDDDDFSGDHVAEQIESQSSDTRLSDKQKEFLAYFHLVWNALGNSNFIDISFLDKKLKIGLYYVMKCFHLHFTESEWGMCRFICLHDENSNNKFEALNKNEILAREIDLCELNKLYSDFMQGVTPDQTHNADIEEKEPCGCREFGWLSPTGEFTESPFGTHEESAEDICNAKNFTDEYFEWVKQTERSIHLRRDFLVEVKGYCLIHNPSGFGNYIVSCIKPLTKKQKDFLYGYFMDMGDKFKAEQFIN